MTIAHLRLSQMFTLEQPPGWDCNGKDSSGWQKGRYLSLQGILRIRSESVLASYQLQQEGIVSPEDP
ncbi:MAG: hypothetical protein AAEJ65_08205 [Planctomycetota bacterium]